MPIAPMVFTKSNVGHCREDISARCYKRRFKSEVQQGSIDGMAE